MSNLCVAFVTYLHLDGIQTLHDLVQVHMNAPGFGDCKRDMIYYCLCQLHVCFALTSVVVDDLGDVLRSIALPVPHCLLLPPQEGWLLPTSP